MSLAKFNWTDRARPIVQMGVGDTRVASGTGRWDTHRWDTTGGTWAGTQPSWLDITCDTHSYRCTYGRQRTTDRFAVGTATVVVDNTTGWADSGNPGIGHLWVRPGASIRMGIVHSLLGVRWLFRGVVDAVTPVYNPLDPDTVELSCVDALGDVNRAKFKGVGAPVGAGDTVTQRIARVLDDAQWPAALRDLQETGDTVIADDRAGQAADLLGQAADSGGGSVFGDYEGRIAFRRRDWQSFTPGTPPDGTIGNVAAGDVCPVRWERPFAREDMATRILIGRDSATAIVVDDVNGQALYGIEPFERTDLLTESNVRLQTLGERYIRTRGSWTIPRVRSVSLDARTADNALDMMTTADVYLPSRYRCRLQYPRGTVFDAEHFATGVDHDITPEAWTLNMNLDLAAPFALTGGNWDGARWNSSAWGYAVTLRDDAVQLLERINA